MFNSDSERKYVDLIFKASKKYASWDPEVMLEVGDWGRITHGARGILIWRRKGTFLKEGNIYKDGRAKKYGILDPKEYGTDSAEGANWITSENAQQQELSADFGVQTPAFVDCKIRASFKFSSGQGAILVMTNDTITTIDPPGSLRRLLKDKDMHNRVIVSEVHRCSSYARLLTSKDAGTVSIGLSIQSAGTPTLASGNAQASWVRNSHSGNFKYKVNSDGARVFYPLCRLTALKTDKLVAGMRGDREVVPLPDAIPPWQESDSDS